MTAASHVSKQAAEEGQCNEGKELQYRVGRTLSGYHCQAECSSFSLGL